MRVLKNSDGSVYAERYELEDMPPCRACGCAPALRGNESRNGCGSTRLQCPKCGMRTGMSTNEQAKYIVWAAAMGAAGGPGGECCGR